mmetsp:Transcript_6154/g.20568  ORF Transcript_6154/g.20568 Transcript_6154/m.20568 type:complete len:237 (-) Transcript_6154:85-795(-)
MPLAACSRSAKPPLSSSPAPAPRSLSSSSPSKSSESDFTPVFLPYNEPPSYPTRPLLLCVPFPSRKLICALSFEASRKGADLVPNLRPRPFRHGFGLSTTFRTLPTCPGRKKGSSFSPASSGDRFLSEDHSRRPNKPSWGLQKTLPGTPAFHFLMSVYNTEAIVASGVLPGRFTKYPMRTAVLVISPVVMRRCSCRNVLTAAFLKTPPEAPRYCIGRGDWRQPLASPPRLVSGDNA